MFKNKDIMVKLSPSWSPWDASTTAGYYVFQIMQPSFFLLLKNIRADQTNNSSKSRGLFILIPGQSLLLLLTGERMSRDDCRGITWGGTNFPWQLSQQKKHISLCLLLSLTFSHFTQWQTQDFYLGLGNGQVKKFNNKMKILIYYYKSFSNYTGVTTWVCPCSLHSGPPRQISWSRPCLQCAGHLDRREKEKEEPCREDKEDIWSKLGTWFWIWARVLIPHVRETRMVIDVKTWLSMNEIWDVKRWWLMVKHLFYDHYNDKIQSLMWLKLQS